MVIDNYLNIHFECVGIVINIWLHDTFLSLWLCARWCRSTCIRAPSSSNKLCKWPTYIYPSPSCCWWPLCAPYLAVWLQSSTLTPYNSSLWLGVPSMLWSRVSWWQCDKIKIICQWFITTILREWEGYFLCPRNWGSAAIQWQTSTCTVIPQFISLNYSP